MSLQIVTPPTAEPVTIDEVKARLRLTTTADDALILQHITTARVFAEKITKKSTIDKGYSLSLPGFPWPNRPILLPVGLVSAVTSITYLDPTGVSQTWDPTEYITGLAQLPAVVLPAAPQGGVYPDTYRAMGLDTVFVAFQAGPAPGALKLDISVLLEGIRQLAMHYYSHPEAINAENLKEMPYGIQACLGLDKTHTF